MALRALLRAAGRLRGAPAGRSRPPFAEPLAVAEQRLVEYRRQGYTIFEGAYGASTIAAWRDEQDRLEGTAANQFSTGRPGWFGNMLERAPHLMWPAVANPLLLTFAERVVGPFLQLDNLTLAGFAAQERNAAGAVSGWHRDRWARMPSGHYERPLGLNAICYLQDLTDESGPLRLIPQSHIEPIAVRAEERHLPHPRERLLHLKAGDVVLTHSSLLHSGTANASNRKRYLLSVYYNISWLRCTDTFDGPNCQEIIGWARRRNDHRSLRLLGVDEHLVNRSNSGFQENDEARWLSWIEEDRLALREE